MNAAAVSAVLKMQLAEVSAAPSQLPEPALCAFHTSSDPGFAVQIFAFPFTTGREKNKSLAAIKDDFKAAVDVSKSQGLTYQITDHPEWGTDAFSLLEYNSRMPEAVEVWTANYSAEFDGPLGKVSKSAYVAAATNLGDALSAVH